MRSHLRSQGCDTLALQCAGASSDEVDQLPCLWTYGAGVRTTQAMTHLELFTSLIVRQAVFMCVCVS